MEWRILTRITLHNDHVKNLQILDLAGFKEQNRYNEILPFKHSQVELGSIISKLSEGVLSLRQQAIS